MLLLEKDGSWSVIKKRRATMIPPTMSFIMGREGVGEYHSKANTTTFTQPARAPANSSREGSGKGGGMMDQNQRKGGRAWYEMICHFLFIQSMA